LKFNVLNNRIEFLFLVGRGLVSRLGDVGSTVSWWEKCQILHSSETIKSVISFWQR